MRRDARRAGQLGWLLIPTWIGAVVLGACSDSQPVAPRAPQPVLPANTIQAFECTATTAGTMSCNAPSPTTGGALGNVMGGQDVYLKLTSQNASYDSGTGIFSVDVTIQNLMNEAMGTVDGSTPAPDGIMVFFHQEPVATTGSGAVSVDNADGTAFFTGPDQAYHRYTEVLDKDEVSSTKTWRFAMDNTVESFRFTVLVQAEMQYDLVINEVFVNPGGTILDANGEWFELYNAGTLPVDLENLVIADSAASGRRPYHRIASSIVVQPGEYAVLGNTTNTTTNGGVPVDYAYGSALQLANSLDAIKIARVVGPDTFTIDRTQYSSPGVSAVNGVSRELTNPALDNFNMDGSNWADALVTAVYGEGGRGTPKAQNSTFTP